MEDIALLHREAMALVDRALVARANGRKADADLLFREAFEKEKQAADLVEDDLEPTRSVLHRSAASLALDCGETREAERLIARALAGDPPWEIAEELRDLLEDTNFQRHLAVRGIALQEDEFQISLEGNAVGYGIAPSDQFIDRVQNIETLLFRTAERYLKRPFRESGRLKKKLVESLELYVSVPRSASLAVTFKVGKSDQMSLPGTDLAKEVIDEFLANMDLLNRGEIEELKKRIGDDSYFRNFVGLGQKIAPDGASVKTVGFTARRHGEEKQIAFTRLKQQVGPEKERLRDKQSRIVEVRGVLLAADAMKTKEGRIEVVDDQQQAHHVRVPRGMMSDIVKPMFEERVIVYGREENGQVVLDRIELDEEST